MILLLGGTSESAVVASALAQAGLTVLVSTATDEPLDVGSHPNIRRRCGRLDEQAMSDLVAREGIAAIVDAAHPYAAALHVTARAVARQTGIAYVRLARPRSNLDDGPQGAVNASQQYIAADHAQAARLAFSFGRPVLLTTGANNLLPYAQESARTGIVLVARVLNRTESLEACTQAGIDASHIIAARGPFTLEQNVQHIRQYGIGTLVTKDSGDRGGTAAKLQAARQENCHVVIIDRPALEDSQAGQVVSSVEELLAKLAALLSRGGSGV